MGHKQWTFKLVLKSRCFYFPVGKATMKYELSRISGAVFKDLFEFGLRGSQDASITTQDYEGFQKWRLMYNSPESIQRKTKL